MGIVVYSFFFFVLSTALVASWKRGQMGNMESQSVDVVAGAIRKFAHEMEASLLTKEQFDLLMKSATTDDVAEKVRKGKYGVIIIP